MRTRPGYRWRVLAHGDDGSRHDVKFEPADAVCFDEVVVDDWLHVEQMDTRHWWIGLSGLNISVWVKSDGRPSVLIELDDPDRLGELRNLAPRGLS